MGNKETATESKSGLGQLQESRQRSKPSQWQHCGDSDSDVGLRGNKLHDQPDPAEANQSFGPTATQDGTSLPG